MLQRSPKSRRQIVHDKREGEESHQYGGRAGHCLGYNAERGGQLGLSFGQVHTDKDAQGIARIEA